MAEALTIYEASIVTEHGLPAAVVYDEDRATYVDFEEVTDHVAKIKADRAKGLPEHVHLVAVDKFDPERDRLIGDPLKDQRLDVERPAGLTDEPIAPLGSA